MRLPAREAARQFVDEFFPSCQVALLAGSVIRGQETPTSDLDLVIIDKNLPYAYRENFFACGWKIETFVYNRTSYRDFFQKNYETANPVLLTMCIEGVIIRDDGFAATLKKEAQEWYDRGPAPLTEEEILKNRYLITDLLDDLEGTEREDEALWIVNSLFPLAARFVMRFNRHWTGDGKWMFRRLQQLDRERAQKYVKMFEKYYLTRQKEPLIAFLKEWIRPCGGRLFAGYSQGKRRNEAT